MPSADMPSSGKAPHASAWLRLAATPAFAAMALLTGSDAQMPMICSAGAPYLAGMAPMYLLMSIFHAGPWLTWIASRQFPEKCPEKFPEDFNARTQRVT